MVTFDQCNFVNIQSNIINFFRDGYDESTIGGVLTVSNSSFTDCGKAEKSGILIQTRGIINVNITGNTFKNNPVAYMALLWGEKNNHHSNNTLTNSGEIKSTTVHPTSKKLKEANKTKLPSNFENIIENNWSSLSYDSTTNLAYLKIDNFSDRKEFKKYYESVFKFLKQNFDRKH